MAYGLDGNNTHTGNEQQSRIRPCDFEKTAGAVYPAGTVEFGFYMMAYDDKTSLETHRKPLDFFGRVREQIICKETFRKYESYVQHTYQWAFDSGQQVWQGELDGKQ